jgi:beta-lactamase superfamily II metal-dependent hydrolase
MIDSKVEIKALLAGNGDSMLITYDTDVKSNINILIDGGNNKAIYNDHLGQITEQIAKSGKLLDLVVITHIDQDHIKGIIYLTRDITNVKKQIKAESVGRYWFNSAYSDKIYKQAPQQFDISAEEMKELEEFLHNQPDERWNIREKIVYPLVKKINGATFTILSPNQTMLQSFTKEYGSLDIATYSDDYTHSLQKLYISEKLRLDNGDEGLDDKLENATSIAFLFEYEQVSMLYLGDAIPMVLDKAIEEILKERSQERLKVDVVKLSHHASRKSISFKFLKIVDCSKFIICTNGLKARLPNKSTFAKILLHHNRDFSKHIDFYFNYPDFSKVLNFTDQEKETYNFSCHDANFEHGYCLTLPLSH